MSANTSTTTVDKVNHAPVTCTLPAGAIVTRFSFISMSFLCLILLLWHSDTAILYMRRGLQLCAKTVIPSLFPFMVISELLVTSGGGELLGKLLERPFRWLFGISSPSVCALIMGLLCGFPVGTKTAVSLYRRGQITQEELSKLICFCNIPSSAFLINAVGISLFGNRHFGLLLYGACLLSSVLTAQFLRYSPHRSSFSSATHTDVSHPNTGFTYAVTSAAIAMLYVCAYIIFFSSLSGILGGLLDQLGLGQLPIAFTAGVLELSGGVSQASAIDNRLAAQWLTALLCGWSGISVHLQIISICKEASPPTITGITRYFFSKATQGIFCALLCGAVLYFSPSSQSRSSFF